MPHNIIREFINDNPTFVIANLLLLAIIVVYIDNVACDLAIILVYLFPLNLAAKLDRELACLLLSSLCLIELISITY